MLCLAVSVGIYEVKVIVNDRLKKTVVAERTYRFSPAQKNCIKSIPCLFTFVGTLPCVVLFERFNLENVSGAYLIIDC